MIEIRSLSRLAVLSSLVLLQACGGGGGSDSPPADTTAPTILSTSISDGATGVSRSTTFVITFSEAVAASSVTSSTILFRQGATPVAFTPSVSGATVTLTPTAALSSQTAYTVQVTTGVTDVAGNALASSSTYGFTTLDDVPPTIVSASIADGATGVSRSAAFVITFSEPIAASSVTSSTILFRQGATPVAFTPSVSGATVTLTPTSTLSSQTAYTVQVTTGVTDVPGNALAAGATWGFTTLDDIPPTIVSVNIADGATGVSRDATFAITFSEPIAPASLTATSIRWMQGSTPVAWTPSISGTTVTLTPTARLANLAPFTVEVTTGVTDVAGNALAVGATWGFTTLDDVPPTVTGTTPANGATGISRSTTVVISFSEAVDDATVTAATVTWKEGATTIPYSKVVSGATVTLTPTVQLGTFALQTVQVTAGVKDLAGNAATPATSVFQTLDDVNPVLATAPTDAGDWTTTTVHLSWSAATDPAPGSGLATGYVVVIATQPSDLFQVGTVTVPTGLSVDYVASNAVWFPDGGHLYAKVQFLDVAGNLGESPWSNGIQIDRGPPVTPLAPTDPGAKQSETAITYTWLATSDAGIGVKDYTIQVATANDGNGIVTSQTVSGLSWVFTGITGQTYYARVLATDLLDQSSVYGPFSDGIQIDTSVPGKPGAPVDGGDYSPSTTLTFTWAAPTGGPAFDSYKIEIGTSPGANDVLTQSGLPTTPRSFTTTVAGPNGTTYYARVAAVSGATPGGWSDPSDGITVDTTAPSAPGKPVDPRGTRDDRYVTFNWPAAVDAQSGIAQYEVLIWHGAFVVGTFYVTDTTYTYDAIGRDGQVLTATVIAQNGAGTWGAASSASDGVTVDLIAPTVLNRSPSPGWTNVGTNTDVVFTFSEAMDEASVEAAFLLQCGTGCPKNGLVFAWSADQKTVTVIPDTADPVGATNVDLLPQTTAVRVMLGATATDLAGNAVQLPPSNDYTFTTADETPPRLVSLTVGGNASPFPPASVQGGFSIVATFDEDMSPTRGAMRLETRQGSIEARYNQTNLMSAASGTPGAGQATYKTGGCPGIQVGDVVTVQFANPTSFNVDRATVTAIGDDGAGNCTFTVANATTDSYANGGYVSYPQPGDAKIAWTGPRTLQLTLPSYVTLSPGTEANVSISDASDVGGMWTWAEQTVQVAVPAASDLVAPRLLASVPAAGATGVTASTPIILRFSEAIAASTVTGAFAADSLGTPYDMKYSSDQFGPVLLFIPRRAPPSGSRVDVHVPGSVKDLAGNQLGSAIDLSFDVATQADLGAPIVRDEIPPDGRPVDQVYSGGLTFEDSITHQLELLDATSVGPRDLRVVDDATGLLVRGWGASIESGSGVLRIDSPPRGPGFQSGYVNVGLDGAVATAATSSATYTTWNPHGLAVGMHVTTGGFPDGRFAVTDAAVTAVTSTTFTLAWSYGVDATTTGGWASWGTPRSFGVSVAVLPAEGGDGILDFNGNAMAPFTFTANLQPSGTNRAPILDSLRDLRLSVSTSAAGRQLSAEARVRDADNDDVTVTLTAKGGTVTFPSATQVLHNTSYGASYRFGDSGGPPTGASPAEMTDANFPTSGYYPFEITLDDGKGGPTSTTTYVREVWVWAPADVPANDAVVDGLATRTVSALRPVVVENTATPTLRWTGVDVLHADFIALQFLELSPFNVGGNSGGPSGVPLAPTATSGSLPDPLEPTLYAWFVDQLKFMPGETSPGAQGWSLDFTKFYEATMVYGPGNRALDGREYGAAQAGLALTTGGAFASSWVASGTYALESATGGAAPVFVTKALTDNSGASGSSTELFAAGNDARFMLTTASTEMMGLPLAYRGVVGRGGRFFAVAGQAPSSILLEAGAWRDPAITYGANLDGKTFGFVQLEADVSGGTLQRTGSSVGVAVAGPSTFTVTGTRHDGSALDTGGPLPYTLGSDGLLTMNIGSEVVGYLGGAPGALMGAIADRTDATKAFLLVMAQKYAGWVGTEGVEFMQGDYRFVEFTQGNDGAGGVGQLHASAGTMSFDGLGGFTYVVVNSGQTMMGSGTYTVDPIAGTVSAVADPGGSATPFLLMVAPDADTLLGTSVSASLDQTPQVLILSR